MREWISRFLSLTVLLLLCSCGGGGGGSSSAPGTGPGPQPPGAPPVRLVAVEFNPPSATLSQGFNLPLRLFALYSNGFRLEVTAQSQLSSNSPAVVLEGNLARAQQIGTATISGRFEGQSTTMQIDVTEALLQSLTVDPASASLPLGTAQVFRALGRFSDGSIRDVTASATWTSPDTNIAQIEPAGGSRALAVSQGETRVRAELSGQSAEARLMVTSARLESIEVTPATLTLPIGIVQAFQATGVFSDNSVRNITEEVSWTSTDSDTLAVSDVAGTRGLAVGLLTGSAQIRASLGALSDAAEVTISPAVLQSLRLEPEETQLPKGLQLGFIARGRFSDGSERDVTGQVLWSSSDPAVAVVSNALGEQGRATGLQVGSTTVGAELNGIQAQASLEVSAAVLQSLVVSSQDTSELPAGLTRQFQATGNFSDGSSRNLSDEVLWFSSDNALASVDAAGLVTALKPGTVNIQAALQSQQSSAPLTISAALLESIDIEPDNAELPKGLELRYTATGHYSDLSSRDISEEVIWRSSSTTVGSISNAPGSQGLARGLSLGNTRISAELGGQQFETGLDVTPAVLQKLLVTPSQQSLPVGFGGQLRAVGVFSDGLQRDLTSQANWSSQVPTTVAVNATGKVSALQLGDADIRAEFQQIEGTARVSVDSTITAIEVVSHNQVLVTGRKGRYFALATLSNGKKRDATHLVQWSVAPSSLATVEQETGEVKPLFVGPTIGSGLVVANLGQLQSSLELEVFPPLSAEAIMAVPQKARLLQGRRLPVSVFSFQHHSDVSNLVNWSSEDAAIAQVVNGQIEALAPGQTTLTARLGDQNSTVAVEVFAGPITQLRLQPTTLEMPVGTQRMVRLEGVTQEGDVVDLTDEAEWTLTQPHLLAVVGGRLEALQQGTSSLTASARGLTSVPCLVTVGPASATPTSWYFVDNRSLPGGDGSLNHPFNNLVEALRVVEAAGTVCVFRGDGSPRGLVGELNLPDQLTLRGEGAGFAELGLTPGAHPQVVGRLFSVGNHNTIQGLHWYSVLSPRLVNAEEVRDLTLSDNGFFDRAAFGGTQNFQFSNLEGLVRFNNNTISSSRFLSGNGGLRWQRSLPGTEPTTLELTNNTFDSGAGLGAVVRVETSGFAFNLAPKLRFDCRDNQFNTSTVALLYNYRGPNGEVSVVNNQTGGQVSLETPLEADLLSVSDNSLGSLSLTATTAGEVTVTNNSVHSTLRVAAGPASSGFPPLPPIGAAEPTVRVDGNRVLGNGVSTGSGDPVFLVQIRGETLLVQSNEAPNGGVTFGTGRSLAKLGVRHNQIGNLNIQPQGSNAPDGKLCVAISSNAGNTLNLQPRMFGTVEVEGLSQLSSLNSYTTVLVATGFVEVAVNSCAIPE